MAEAQDNPMPKLYDFQLDVLLRTQSALMAGKKVILQMPTGAGKTVTAARLVELESKRGTVWFVCHRKQIVKQASKMLTSFGLDHGVIAPKHKKEYDRRIQVVSIGALTRRLKEEINPPDVVFYDEAHHIVAKTWIAVMELFPDAKHVGLTATPERLDGKGLDEAFDELVIGPSPKWLIENEYLSNYRMYVPTEPDLTAARMSKGDYNQGDIDKIMNTPVLIGDALKHYQEIAPGSRALAFAASVAHSKALVEKFNAAGIPAVHVDGNTDDDIREKAIADLEAGNIKMLSNFGVFDEGFDLPAIDCVILLRPTKSLRVYLQMVGRGMRSGEGKGDTVLLDHSGLYHTFGKPDYEFEWTLAGGALGRRNAAVRANGGFIGRKCPKCSEVHTERVMVCDCGFEFPMGRDVGEFDGELCEVDAAIPSGCMTKYAFSKKVGISISSVRRWADKGMPMCNGFVVVDESESWISSNAALTMMGGRYAPEGLFTVYDYAIRCGVTPTIVRRWIDFKGMPTKGKYIDPKEADSWVDENWANPAKLSPFCIDPHKYVSPQCLARRIAVSINTVRTLVKKGKLERLPNGWINYEKAIEYIKKNEFHPHGVGGLYPGKAYQSYAEYGMSKGLSPNVVRHYSRIGGFGKNNYVDVIAADEWIDENVKDGRLQRVLPLGTATRPEMAKILGISIKKFDHQLRRGRPKSFGGSYDVRGMIRWFSENTEIQIPPEAWPKKEEDK